MSEDFKFYFIAVVAIAISFGGALLIPVPLQYQGIITLPGVISLFSIVIQAWRDKRAHERQLDLQNRRHDFTLAVASHIAAEVFDRQASFSEEYFAAAHESLRTLFSQGPSPDALDHAKNLIDIRTKYSPWLPPTVFQGLLPFEQALRQISAQSMTKDAFPEGEERAKWIREMYQKFTETIDLSPLEEGQEAEEGFAAVVSHLREVMRVKEITALRDDVISTAFSRLSGNIDSEA